MFAVQETRLLSACKFSKGGQGLTDARICNLVAAMSRFHKVLLAVAIICVLAFALKIRFDEAGYRNYYLGNFAAAIAGLVGRAQVGEPFAALLVGNIYAFGKGLEIDPAKASDWYLKQAQMGDITGVRFFVQNAFREYPLKSQDLSSLRCRTAVELLDMAARADDIGANIELGNFYQSGLCVEQSTAKAAYYFQNVSRLDRQLSFLFKKIRRTLTESERAQLERDSSNAKVKPSVRSILDIMIRSQPVLRAPDRIMENL
jgi:hypothetical protein